MDVEALTTSSGLERLSVSGPMGPSGPQALHVCTFPGCSKAFTHRGNMTRHAKTHTEVRYVCPVEGCGREFDRTDSRLQHIRKHHPDHAPQASQYAHASHASQASLASQAEETVTRQPAQPTQARQRKRVRRTAPEATASVEAVASQEVASVESSQLEASQEVASQPEEPVTEEAPVQSLPLEEAKIEEAKIEEVGVEEEEEGVEETKDATYMRFNRQVTISGIRQLMGGPSARLDGPICDALLSMIQICSRTSPEDAPIMLFNTVFYSTLCTYSEDYQAVVGMRGYVRDKNIFDTTVVIPVSHVGSANGTDSGTGTDSTWSLIVVEPTERRMTYYDSSLRTSAAGAEAMCRIHSFFATEHLFRTQKLLPEWTMEVDTGTPIHQNDDDSGVYMCLIAQRVMRCVRKRKPVCFEDMPTNIQRVRAEWFNRVLVGK